MVIEIIMCTKELARSCNSLHCIYSFI